jgi:hypothetical protein
MAYTQQGLNQFGQSNVPGVLDLQSRGGSIFTCQVSSSQATPLVPGQAVKLDTSSNDGVPKVLGLTANTDATFGFVVFTVKDQTFPAYSNVEIASLGTVMYMNAGAAITRGAPVEVQYTTNDVITNAGTNEVVGIAYDGASGVDKLCRILILPPAFENSQTIGNIAGLQAALNNRTQVANITVTQAQLNAGQVLIPGVAGQSISVVDVIATFTGTFATGTAMVLEDTSAVIVDTLALAGMAAGVVRMPLPNAIDSHQTLGAGAGVPLTAGAGLQLVKSGSAFTGGTNIVLQITYKQA